MDKVEKDQQQQQVENQLEDNMVFELFGGLLKEITIKQPAEPLDWLIARLRMKSPQRVVVLGPPGGSKKEVCAKLAKAVDIKHINAGSLVWAEVEEKTAVGKKIEALGFNDVEFVDDNVITDLVKKTISKFDVLVPLDGPKNLPKGWVLDGQPRTFNQAQLMQVSGFLPDRVVVLHEDRARCIAELVKRFQRLQNVTIEEATRMADVKQRNYSLHLNKIKEAFRDIILEVDTTAADAEATFKRVKGILEIRPREKIAQRPPTLAILGPPCSGKMAISNHFASKQGLVHITPQAILAQEAKADSPLSAQALDCLQNGTQLDDEVMCKLVINTLQTPKCEFNGWVLEGFPETAAQLHLLMDAGKTPKMVCQRDQDKEEVQNKAGLYRMDPETWQAVNVKDVALSVDEMNRLVSNPFQEEKNVESRQAKQMGNKDAIQDLIVGSQQQRCNPADTNKDVIDKLDEVINLLYKASSE